MFWKKLMFWKKKRAEAAPPTAEPAEAKAKVPKKPKAKELSPKGIIINQIEQLGPGQSVRYRLPDTFGDGLAVVELNPQYPKKGKKYIVSTEKLVDDKPAGHRSRLWDSNNAKDVAGWIMERKGDLFS